MITLEQIRERLKEAIKQSELSQTEICHRIGIKTPTMSQYLSGRAMPALDTFANLCAVLDVDPADILCIDEYGKSEKKNVRISDSFNNNSGSINFKA